jgi:hypothetical protein
MSNYAPIRSFVTFYVICPRCDNEVFSSTDEFPEGAKLNCEECGYEFIATEDLSNAEQETEEENE